MNYKDSRLMLIQPNKAPSKLVTSEEKQQDQVRILNEYLRSKKLRNHTEKTINSAQANIGEFFYVSW